jgi:uncharacterized metal-binding protein YceD (DUF177 family)
MITDPAAPLSHPLVVRQLPARKATRFDLVPEAATRAALAAQLGLLDLPYLRFKGELQPKGRSDIHLSALMEAVVVQPCSVTLVPVTTRLAEPVTRRYLAEFADPQGDEVELTGDDCDEPLPEVIDPGLVAVEALALALPQYPRAPGAGLGEAVFAPPGAAPLREADLKPFAGLAGLFPKAPDDDGQAG